MKNALAFALAFVLALPLPAQFIKHPPVRAFASLPTCDASLKGRIYSINNASAENAWDGAGTATATRRCDGAAWVIVAAGGAGASPGGASGDVQYNDGAGGFAGEAGLNYVDGASDNTLKLTGHPSQTLNLFEFYDSTPTLLYAFDAAGRFTGPADSLDADQDGTDNVKVTGLVLEFDPDDDGVVEASIGNTGDVLSAQGAGGALIRHATDSNTGVYYEGTDRVSLRSGGAARVEAANAQVTVSVPLELTPQASAPTCGATEEGQLYSDSTGSKALCWCDGTAWQKILGAGTCA